MIQPTLIDTTPPPAEGSKACLVPINWALVPPVNQYQDGGIGFGGSRSVTVNLLPQYQSGQFTTVQTVLFDNTTCPYPVTITSQQTQQRLLLPPFSQGALPLAVSAPAVFMVALDLALNFAPFLLFVPCTTNLQFLNTPCKPWIYEQTIGNPRFSFETATTITQTGDLNQLFMPPNPQWQQAFGFMAIEQVQVGLFCSAGYGATTTNTVRLYDGNDTVGPFYEAYMQLPATAGCVFTGSATYDPPVFLWYANGSGVYAGIWVELDTLPTSGTVSLHACFNLSFFPVS